MSRGNWSYQIAREYVTSILRLRCMRSPHPKNCSSRVDGTGRLGSAHLPAIVLTPEGVVKHWNGAVQELCGYTPAQMVGRNLSNFLVPQPAGSHGVTHAEDLNATIASAAVGRLLIVPDTNTCSQQSCFCGLALLTRFLRITQVDTGLSESRGKNFVLEVRKPNGSSTLLYVTASEQREQDALFYLLVGQAFTHIHAQTLELQRKAADLSELMDKANTPIFSTDNEGLI
eukprot:3992567-Pyramimonas_sp.AAC.1